MAIKEEEKEKLKNEIFDILINCELSLYETVYAPIRAVVEISNIMELLKENKASKYSVRKALKSLIGDGLIFYTSQGCPAVESCGEYRELIREAAPPINGYALTNKGYNSPRFQKAVKDWEASLKEWAEGGGENESY